MGILVTGGAGYVGSHAALALLAAGERVVVLDDLSTGLRELVPAGAALAVGDAGNQALVRQLVRDHDIDAIMHFAGSIVVPESVAAPLQYYKNNTVKSRALLEAAVESDVRHFVFSSSAAVYGVPDEIPVPEDAPLRPISPYGSSKLMTEVMLRDIAAAHDMTFASLRYFNVAGADPALRTGQCSRRATHLIKVACEAAVGKRRHVDIYGTDYETEDGTCVRDYVHVSDLATAHVQALRYLRNGGDPVTLNCGYSTGYSVLEVIDAVRRVSGVDFPVRVGPRRPGDPAVLVARSKLAVERIGWRPVHAELDRIVEHSLAWEAKLRTGSRAPMHESSGAFA